MEKIKIALIGVGSMGKTYAKMIDGDRNSSLTLAVVCCRSLQSKQWVKENLSSEAVIFDSAEAMYEEAWRFDAVFIVTPHRTHPQLAVQAFEHGKHVFCDKPSGVSLLQCRAMNEAAAASGKKFAMMFHQRLYRKYNRIKNIIGSGELGKISRVLLENSRYFRTARYHQSADWRSSWRGEGGGGLINQGQHILDIWQWLFGMPVAVYAQIPFGKYNEFLVDDEATVLMEYPDKMTAAFILTTGEGTWTEKLEIVGTRGKLLLEDDTLHFWKYSEDTREYGKRASCNAREELGEEYKIEEFGGQKEPYPQMFENFAAAVLAGGSLTACGEEGIRALEIANAAYLSAWMGKKVTLPIDAGAYERELEKRVSEEEKLRKEPHMEGGGNE